MSVPNSTRNEPVPSLDLGRLKKDMMAHMSALTKQAHKSVNLDRQIGAVLTIIRQPEANKLRRAVMESPDALVVALYAACRFGADLTPELHEGYLVPYEKFDKDRNPIGWDIQFSAAKRGIIKRLKGSGDILDAKAAVVYEGDHWRHEEKWSAKGGDESVLEWRPYEGPDPEKRGKPVRVFAVAILPGGLVKWRVLSVLEVETRHRARSPSPNGPAWRDNWDRMAEKSALKELFAEIPMTAEGAEAVVYEGKTIDVPADDVIPVAPEPEAEPAKPKAITDDRPAQQQTRDFASEVDRELAGIAR